MTTRESTEDHPRDSVIDRRTLLAGAAAALLVGPLAAEAQQAENVPRIGILYSGLSGAPPSVLEGFRHGLRERGYVEPKSIAIEWRFDDGNPARLPNLAAELVRLKVDVIVAIGGTQAILAAKNATGTIPIVFPTAGDPVAQGIVASFARPGGNITGLTLMTPELGGKKLELLKEVVPSARRVAVLGQEANAFTAFDFRNLQASAATMGLQLHHIEVRGPDDFESAFSRITTTVRATALFLQAVALFFDSRRHIADLAARNRLPAIADLRELTEAGILMSYGADRNDLGRRAAGYVDKILKGAKPADLPVERPTKFELAVNLKTAKALRLHIPQSLVSRADLIIEQ
jgi:putative ABC transport system substrate-binding protein